MKKKPTSISPTTTEPAQDLRDPSLLASFRAFRESQQLTESTADLTSLANRMGTTHTYLYRWINNKFLGDLSKFEASVRAWLAGDHEAKAEVSSELVAFDFIVERVRKFLNHVKRHRFIGIGHGPAGRGKTCAAKIYAAKDPSAIYIHATCWLANRTGIARKLSKITGIKATKGLTLDESLVARLKDSDRIIIIDNAQRLTESARRWLADFWEATQMPIALLGNPEIEQQWQRNDQHGSRVGLHRDVTADITKTAEATAAHLIRLHLPAAVNSPAVLADAVQDILHFGSCRTVVMRARLAAELLAGGKVQNDPAKAFKLAKTQLIKPAA